MMGVMVIFNLNNQNNSKLTGCNFIFKTSTHFPTLSQLRYYVKIDRVQFHFQNKYSFSLSIKAALLCKHFNP